jgi:prolyl-tRNA synthetase
MSQLFSETLRDAPADAEAVSHQLLARAGFIRQLGAGIYSLMPLAKRSVTKIENILREEMDAIGGQEIFMPVVHPADLWKETDRWYKIGDEMTRFHDKNQRDMVLAMTHEEIVADLSRKEIQSYRQLPVMIYHIQTKWRDDPRPRAGLIRVREFTMKDSYSLDADEAGLDVQYRAHYQAYFNIFARCGLPVITVLSDVGMMGGSMAHEYMYLADIGEDTLVLCDQCGYRSNKQIARFKKPAAETGKAKDLEKIATPGTATIAQLAQFLEIPESQTAKVVFLMGTFLEDQQDVEKLVFAIVRGDMELNETKLANIIKSKELRAAQDDEIKAVGAVPGYASPIGLDSSRFLLVADDLVAQSTNLVAGTNEEGFHFKNVNYGRDFEARHIGDIVSAQSGYACINCGAKLHESRGVEVGNIFKLGTDFTVPMGAYFLDKDGKSKPIIMGSYGIGVGRLLQCAAEEHNDEHGLIWPITIAPYHVHLVALRGGEEQAEQLYGELREAGVDVLFDDRDERPGVKFNDADLIGIPVRVTVSERSLAEGNIEFKLRREEDRSAVPLDKAVEHILETIASLRSEIAENVRPIEYEE